jgi:hypothetical protein
MLTWGSFCTRLKTFLFLSVDSSGYVWAYNYREEEPG